MSRRIITTALCAALTATLTPITTAPAVVAASEQEPCTLPDASHQHFEQRSPESLGFNRHALHAAMTSQDWQAASGVTLVLRHGCMAGLTTDTADEWQKFESFSVAKGLTAVSIGVAMHQGQLSWGDTLGSLDQRAAADTGNITLNNLANQNAGWRYNPLNDFGAAGPILWGGWFTNTDVVRFQIAEPLTSEPGTVFNYQQPTVTVAGHFVSQATGMNLKDFDDEYLMKPLGIPANEWSWLRDSTDAPLGFMGVNMSAPYWARIGQMLLNDGTYNGQRIVTPSFVHQIQQPSTTNPAYSHFFWVNNGSHNVVNTPIGKTALPGALVPGAPRDLYMFHGLLGQVVAIIPSLDMVIVRSQINALDPSGSGAMQLVNNVVNSLVDTSAADMTSRDTHIPSLLPPSESQDPWDFFSSLFTPTALPLPRPGPRRSRALVVQSVTTHGSQLTALISCPQRGGTGWCTGVIEIADEKVPVHLLQGTRHEVTFATHAEPGDILTVSTLTTSESSTATSWAEPMVVQEA